MRKVQLNLMDFSVLWWVATSIKVHYCPLLWQSKNRKKQKWFKRLYAIYTILSLYWFFKHHSYCQYHSIVTLLFHTIMNFGVRVELTTFLMLLCADGTYRHVLPDCVRPHRAGPGHRVLSPQWQHHRQRLRGLQCHGRYFCFVTATIEESFSLVL